MTKDNYIEIEVPISSGSSWMDELHSELRRFDVKWQNGFYHITMAFMHNSTDEERKTITDIVDDVIASQNAFPMTFGELDAFTTRGKRTHVIYLRPTESNTAFNKMVNTLRSRISEVTTEMEPDFQLHVTLGRVDATNVTLQNLKKAIEYVDAPEDDIVLRKINHQTFKEYGKPIKSWNLA